jgi:hypothetical protein
VIDVENEAATRGLSREDHLEVEDSNALANGLSVTAPNPILVIVVSHQRTVVGAQRLLPAGGEPVGECHETGRASRARRGTSLSVNHWAGIGGVADGR